MASLPIRSEGEELTSLYVTIFGSQTWKEMFDQRTAVKRVYAYLKEYFKLSFISLSDSEKSKAQFDRVTIVYNASKLAVDRIRKQMEV